MEHETSDEIRTSAEVARRALSLFAVVAVAFGAERNEIVGWLNDNGLFGELSPIEAKFISDPAPSERQIVNAGWYSERLIVLAWALGLVPMPLPNEQCDTALLQKILPPYAGIGPDEFVRAAQLRTDAELIAAADSILHEHWEARDVAIHNREPRIGVDLEVIQERHHAINWIIGYDGAPWDEVTTDT